MESPETPGQNPDDLLAFPPPQADEIFSDGNQPPLEKLSSSVSAGFSLSQGELKSKVPNAEMSRGSQFLAIVVTFVALLAFQLPLVSVAMAFWVVGFVGTKSGNSKALPSVAAIAVLSSLCIGAAGLYRVFMWLF